MIVKAPRPGFEPGNPCGNKLYGTFLESDSRLTLSSQKFAQYRVVPPRHNYFYLELVI